jgi:hypothetical protein
MEQPYESWAFFLRENGGHPERVFPYVKWPDHVRTDEQKAEFYQNETVLTDLWGNVSVYYEDFGDWLDEQ